MTTELIKLERGHSSLTEIDYLVAECGRSLGRIEDIGDGRFLALHRFSGAVWNAQSLIEAVDWLKMLDTRCRAPLAFL